MNTAGSLHAQLRGRRCRPTTADTAVLTIGGNVRYPDVVVDCGQRNDQAMRATTPTLVIEVLSQSTRLFDSHKKVNEYKSHPDIKYILLVDTDNACSLLHYREGDGWQEVVYNSLDDVIEFPEIGASLALRDIYDGLEFKPKLVRAKVCPKCGMGSMRLWRRRPHALIWTFLRVSISRFRGLCRSSSAYSPTMRPVPGIWRRLGGEWLHLS